MPELNRLLAVPPSSFEECKFNDEERAYIYWRGVGLTPSQALRRSGYPVLSTRFEKVTKVNELEANPKIRAAIQHLFEENRVRYNLDRDRVVEGLLEAINVAREQSDSTAMINGWKELAKVTGVGAPERKEIVLTQNNPSTEALRQAPDDELLKLLGKQRTLGFIEPPVTIEDAEYEEIAADAPL